LEYEFKLKSEARNPGGASSRTNSKQIQMTETQKLKVLEI